MKINKIVFVPIVSMVILLGVSVNAFGDSTFNTKGNGSVSVDTNLSGIKSIKYKLQGATEQNWTEYTAPFEITNKGITFITTKIEDNAGNISEETSIAKIGEELLGVSGIKSIKYRLEGATKQGWREYTTPVKITNKGITFITTKIEDNAGNISEKTFIIKIGVDGINGISGIKKIEYKLQGAIETDWQTYTEPLELTGNGFLMIMARAIDKAGNVAEDISYVQAVILGNSGIDKILYKLDGATKQDWTEYSNVFTIKNKGITSILVKALDKAGNIAYENSVAKIGFENVTPSEIGRVEYKLTGATEQDWTEYTAPFYIENEGITYITARAYDVVGNVSEEVSGQVKLDKTAPINNSIKVELFN